MKHNNAKILFSTIFHLVGILGLFTLFASFFISREVGVLVMGLMGNSQISGEIVTPLFVLFGLSCSVWGMTFLFFHSLTRSGSRTLRRTHGTIMTETIIVLPIFLLLTSGLAQMGINSMAGLLTTVGVFQASRTVAVWSPEIGKQRIDGQPTVTEDMVRDRARIAVAAVVTPVARSRILGESNCSPTDTFKSFAKGMGASLNPVYLIATPSPVIPEIKMWTYMDAFGDQSFMVRGQSKMLSAYCSTEIEGSFPTIDKSQKNGVDFTITAKYDHLPSFPIVQKIFNDTVITRNYTMHTQLPANDTMPKAQ